MRGTKVWIPLITPSTIDAHDPVPHLVTHLCRRGRTGDTGVVEQQRHRPEPRLGIIRDCRPRLAIANVELRGHDLGQLSKLLPRRGKPVGVDIGDGDLDTTPSEHPRDRETNALRTTRHERSASFELRYSTHDESPPDCGTAAFDSRRITSSPAGSTGIPCSTRA